MVIKPDIMITFTQLGQVTKIQRKSFFNGLLLYNELNVLI